MPIWMISALSMFGIGMLFALALGIANMKLKVEEDPKVEKVHEALPGVDCGACGMASCHAYAEAVVEGTVPINKCMPGGGCVAEQIAEILGIEPLTVSNKIAVVHCGATEDTRLRKGVYTGVPSCLAAQVASGGDVACPYGCLGQGDCFNECPFDAIRMVNGLPKIDPDKCTACGKCVAACPRNLIEVVDYEPSNGLVAVTCSSKDKGPDVKAVCEVGCIACRLCIKQGPEGVFSVEDNLSYMDYDKYTDVDSCQAAIDKCPTNCINVIDTRKA